LGWILGFGNGASLSAVDRGVGWKGRGYAWQMGMFWISGTGTEDRILVLFQGFSCEGVFFEIFVLEKLWLVGFWLV
jgi:hypothetical protein